MTTTYHLLATVHIPRGMVWTDEHDWQPVEAATEYTLTGALIYDAAVRQAGRPITLQAEESAGWMRRDTLQSVRALAADPGQVYALTLADGRSFDVCFAPSSPLEARPISRPEVPQADHPYIVTLRLIAV